MHLLLPKFSTLLAMAEKQPLLGPRDGHIHKPALLLQIRFLTLPRRDRKQVFLHSDDPDGRKFQAFRCVNGHQRNGRLVLVVFIGIGKQAQFLQIGLQCRVFRIGFVVGDRILQLLNVVSPCLQVKIVFPFHRI